MALNVILHRRQKEGTVSRWSIVVHEIGVDNFLLKLWQKLFEESFQSHHFTLLIVFKQVWHFPSICRNDRGKNIPTFIQKKLFPPAIDRLLFTFGECSIDKDYLPFWINLFLFEIIYNWLGSLRPSAVETYYIAFVFWLSIQGYVANR